MNNKTIGIVISISIFVVLYVSYLIHVAISFEFKEYKSFGGIVIKRKVWNFPHFHNSVGSDVLSVTKNGVTKYLNLDYIRDVDLKNDVLTVRVIKRGVSPQEDEVQVRSFDLNKMFE